MAADRPCHADRQNKYFQRDMMWHWATAGAWGGDAPNRTHQPLPSLAGRL